MRVKLLDTQTGETKWSEYENFDAFWWEEGNGSCDCNRCETFGVENESEHACDGCKRFLVVEFEGNDKPTSLLELNAWYPVDLVKAHLPGLKEVGG